MIAPLTGEQLAGRHASDGVTVPGQQVVASDYLDGGAFISNKRILFPPPAGPGPGGFLPGGGLSYSGHLTDHHLCRAFRIAVFNVFLHVSD